MLTPRRFEDGRGFFCENYHKRRLTEVGIDADIVQDNLSLSKPAGRPGAFSINSAYTVLGLKRE